MQILYTFTSYVIFLDEILISHKLALLLDKKIPLSHTAHTTDITMHNYLLLLRPL